MHWMTYVQYSQIGSPFWGFFSGFIWGFFLFILAAWSVIWKGAALWKAARKGHTGWFIALLVVNTLGILEILYIYKFCKKSKSAK